MGKAGWKDRTAPSTKAKYDAAEMVLASMMLSRRCYPSWGYEEDVIQLGGGERWLRVGKAGRKGSSQAQKQKMTLAR